jgi:uncharacterized membrane protein YdbT with pleckstrin-like domain
VTAGIAGSPSAPGCPPNGRACAILGGMPYPDKLLADDEEVVRHLHPHWLAVFWPVVRLLLIVGAASFGAAMVPVGRQQGVVRLVIVAVALLLLLVTVLRPLLRWRTTHYVITTHRLLFREGILSRRGRDLGLSRITDVSFTQTLWERIINSGTITIQSAGEHATVLSQIPDSDGVQQLLNHMVEEDADRRAQETAGYIRGEDDAPGDGYYISYDDRDHDGGGHGYGGGHRTTAY